MGKDKSRYRSPDGREQEILDGLEIRLIRLEETGRFNELVAMHHYLKSAVLVGEHMRYVAAFEGEWLALGAWSAGAMYLKGLDEDRSRVRNPNAALVLGMFRRVVVSFAIPWSQEKKKTNKRTSTRTTTAAPSTSSPPRPQPHGKIRKNQPYRSRHVANFPLTEINSLR